MLKQALALAKAGRTAQAAELYEKLLKAKPDNVAVLRAVIHFHNRYSLRFRRAVPLVGTLLKQEPKAAQSHALAAETLCNCARLPQAKHHAHIAREIAPNDPDVLFIAAYVAMEQQGYDVALGYLDHALSVRPDHRPSLLQRGRALLGMGEISQVQQLCRDLLKVTPDDMNVIGLYINATRIKRDDLILVHARDNLLPQYEKMGGINLSHLLRLLGKAHNDFGDYVGAFGFFERAKSALPLKYNADGYGNFVSTLCANITRADYFGRGDQSEQPVLIVGMPRSGSTLLEQILASHPQVASVGESPSLNVIVQDTKARTHNGGDMVGLIKQIPDEATRKIAARYLAETAQGAATRVIDKSLHNFELLGFFAAILPRARIIHMRRDPMDTCVSCYMQNLSAWHKYTQSLDTMGHAYVQYDRLMQHWKTVLPNPMLEVRYEDTVQDIESVARRAVAFLGLDWDPACLNYQNTKNKTRTLSSGQVREPLYTTSLQRWRRYEPHLAPLKRHLAPFYPDGFDVAAGASKTGDT